MMIGNVIAVLSKKMMNSLPSPMGILQPRVTPQTSDKYIRCVILKAPTTNLVMSEATGSIKIADRNMSVNPINSVSDADCASSIPTSPSSGTNGAPIDVNTGVYSATIVPSVPIAITIGSTANHISPTVFNPSFK